MDPFQDCLRLATLQMLKRRGEGAEGQQYHLLLLVAITDSVTFLRLFSLSNATWTNVTKPGLPTCTRSMIATGFLFE